MKSFAIHTQHYQPAIGSLEWCGIVAMEQSMFGPNPEANPSRLGGSFDIIRTGR